MYKVNFNDRVVIGVVSSLTDKKSIDIIDNVLSGVYVPFSLYRRDKELGDYRCQSIMMVHQTYLNKELTWEEPQLRGDGYNTPFPFVGIFSDEVIKNPKDTKRFSKWVLDNPDYLMNSEGWGICNHGMVSFLDCDLDDYGFNLSRNKKGQVVGFGLDLINDSNNPKTRTNYSYYKKQLPSK